MKAEIEFKGALQSVDVKPGDRFVLKLDRVPSSAEAQSMIASWNHFSGNAPLLMIMTGSEISVIRETEDKTEGFEGMCVDRRTGRPFGDHGTALQAIEFAVSNDGSVSGEEYAFLSAWMKGDLSEFPEFCEWLNKQ